MFEVIFLFVSILVWLLFAALQIVPFVLVFLVFKKALEGKVSRPLPVVSATSDTSPTEEELIQSLLEVDEQFSVEGFKAYAKEVVVTVQEGIESQNPEMIRPIETDSLYFRHVQQIEDLKGKQWTLHSDEQSFQSIEFTHYKSEAEHDYLIVRIRFSSLEYTLDANRQVIRGSQQHPRVQTVSLTFKRHQSLKTTTDVEVALQQCPSCGAPMMMNASGRCEFCGHLVSSGKHDWLLDEWSVASNPQRPIVPSSTVGTGNPIFGELFDL